MLTRAPERFVVSVSRASPSRVPSVPIRAAIDQAALALPPETPLILTDALSDDPADDALFAPTRALARARGARLLCVTLDLDPQENRKECFIQRAVIWFMPR